MLRAMDFLGFGIPVGKYFGIQVRLHFTFVIFAFWRVMQYQDILLGLAVVVGLYVCILLHEFGHALAARWCDGEATEILLWPLGGLAFVRPAFHPMAHLITTVAGPFVTLVLWAFFYGFLWLYQNVLPDSFVLPNFLLNFIATMAFWNFILLIFNLIPAFPMDGGRILRDLLWFGMSAEASTRIAVNVSRAIAAFWAIGTLTAMAGLWDPDGLTGVLAWVGMVISKDSFWPLLMAAFIFFGAQDELRIVDFEGRGTFVKFSVLERLRRGARQRSFHQAVKQRGREDAASTFHRCAMCGLTEREAPHMSFRVCTDCANFEEYCAQHINDHKHR